MTKRRERSEGPAPSAASLDQATALGTSPIGRLLWHACTTTTMSVGVYGVYALTNAWFVAHGVGTTALAAVNLAAPVLLILGAVATTVGVGGASLVSRALGAGDHALAARAAGNAFVVFWICALAITVVGLLGIEPLLTLLGAQGETREMAREYTVIILAGSLLSTGFSSLVRAEGRMRFSMMIWLVPVLVQMMLDPLLIFGFHLGVRGAAFGTVGGQGVSAAMSVWFFFVQRHRLYRIHWSDLRPHAATIRAVVGIGAPSFLAGFGTTLLTVLVNSTLSRTGGASALAAFAVCSRIQTFVTMPQTGITQGLQPIVGYNVGLRLYSRALRARVLALRATLIYGVAVALAVVLLAYPLARAFVDDAGTVTTAVQALRFLAVGFAVAGVAPLVAGYCQSLGRATPSYLISIGTLVLIKVPLVMALGNMGEIGIWIALPTGELLSAVAAYVVLRALRGPASSSG